MGNFCYRCMQATVQNGVCTKCGELESSNSSNGENALAPGTNLGKDRITVGKKLGSGGFGVTYIAYDNKLKRRVALKEFMPNYLATREGTRIVPKSGQNEAYEKAMNSFMKEARALYELRAHPNIVHVISVFKENNTAYYTMEMLEGESLLNYLKRKKKISANRAFQLLLPIMKAIQYVHSKKMIHRDISPDNIMLCDNPDRPGSVIPKLIDFGAAHVAIEGYSLSYPGVKKNGFSPLEQNWEGKSQGPWTDVYSFCATFYSAIIGNVPISAQARAEADKDPLKPPRELGADIIPEMQEVLMRGLKLHYQERIQTMDQLIMEMSRAVESTANSTMVEVSVQAVPEPKKRPTVRRVLAWLLEAGLFAAGVIFLKDSSFLQELDIDLDPMLLAILITAGAIFLIDLILLVSAGSTIGQLFFGLKVREEDGEGKPGFGSAMAYSLLYASFGIPVGAILGFIWLCSGKNIGPLEKLTALNVGLRNEPDQAQRGMSGIVSKGVSVPVSRYEKSAGPIQTPGNPDDTVKPQNAHHADPKPQEEPKPQSEPQPKSEPKPKSEAQPPKPEPDPKPVQRPSSEVKPQPAPVRPSGQAQRPKSEPAPRPKSEPAKPAPRQQSVPPVPPPVKIPQTPSQQSQSSHGRLVCTKAGETAAALQGKSVNVRDGSKMGKNPQLANIVIPDKTVSGLHCSFHFVQGKGWTIKDEDSTNGTYINGVRLSSGGSSPLRDGSKITTGKETFEFKC